MIYPAARAVALTAAGAPVALIAGLIAPSLWAVCGAWLALIAGLMLLDVLLSPARTAVALEIDVPGALGVGARGEMKVRAALARTPSRGMRYPAFQVAVQTNDKLTARPSQGALTVGEATASAAIALIPVRRGRGEISAVWLRWRGPLGLVWTQARERTARAVAITPDIQSVKSEAIRLFSREASIGLRTQLETGEGSEFHALREADRGADPRTIDWKQSARHGRLLGKEFRVERNLPVVFAIDTGRVMGEPLLGAPRLDLAINAALRLAYVCLKLGDLAGAYGFDARPGAFSGLVSGPAGFPRLQSHMAAFDYGEDETNHTLGFTRLDVALRRRSLVVIFTDFADATGAELMLETIGRLLRRHVVLFMVLRDEDLEAIVRAEPATAEAVTRAVTAHALMRERQLVIARLARLGARIVDAPAAQIGAALISAYLSLKRSEAL